MTHPSPPKKTTLKKAGKITSAHGVKGLVKIRPDVSSIDVFLDLSDYCFEDGTPIKITPKFTSKDLLVAELEGIHDKTAADALKNTTLYTHHTFSSSPDSEEYLYDDLLSLDAYAQNKCIGTISAITNHGAGDILEIKLNDPSLTQRLDIPFSKNYVLNVDFDAKRVTLDPDGFQSFLSLYKKDS